MRKHILNHAQRKLAAHQGEAFQHAFTLRNHLAPFVFILQLRWILKVDFQDAPARRFPVGAHVHAVTGDLSLKDRGKIFYHSGHRPVMNQVFHIDFRVVCG